MDNGRASWASLSAAYNALHGDGGPPFHVATDRGNGWLSGIRAAILDASPRGRVVVRDDDMRATAERLRAIVGAHGVEIVVNRLPYMRV